MNTFTAIFKARFEISRILGRALNGLLGNVLVSLAFVTFLAFSFVVPMLLLVPVVILTLNALPEEK